MVRSVAIGVALSAMLVGHARADEAAPLFDPAAVAEIDFGLTPEDRAALDADPSTYVPATFSVTLNGAASTPTTVGLRLRGSTSFRTMDGKASFKLKFKEFGGPKFLGLKKLTLNNMKMMAERGVWTTNLTGLLVGFGSFILVPRFDQVLAAEAGFGFGASVTEAVPANR